MHIYGLSGDTLTPKATYDHTGAVLDVKYSPDGSLLACCDANRRVALYSVPDYGVSYFLNPLSATLADMHQYLILTEKYGVG